MVFRVEVLFFEGRTIRRDLKEYLGWWSDFDGEIDKQYVDYIEVDALLRKVPVGFLGNVSGNKAEKALVTKRVQTLPVDHKISCPQNNI